MTAADYFNQTAYLVEKSGVELYDAVPASSPITLTGTAPTVTYRCRAKVAYVTGHADCAGSLVINSDTLTFTASGQIKICTTSITASTLPVVTYSGLDCSILIECLDTGGSPIMTETLTTLAVRHEPEYVTVREPNGSFTSYNGYCMVVNSTIAVGDVIRVSSADYSIKRIEPMTNRAGTEIYRIVYF